MYLVRSRAPPSKKNQPAIVLKTAYYKRFHWHGTGPKEAESPRCFNLVTRPFDPSA